MRKRCWIGGWCALLVACTENDALDLPPVDATAAMLLFALESNGAAPEVVAGTRDDPPELRWSTGDQLEVWAYKCPAEALGVPGDGPATPLPYTAQAFQRVDSGWAPLDEEARRESTLQVSRRACTDPVLEARVRVELVRGHGVADGAWLDESSDRIVVVGQGADGGAPIWVGDSLGLEARTVPGTPLASAFDPVVAHARLLVRRGQELLLHTLDADGTIVATEPGPIFSQATMEIRLAWSEGPEPEAYVITRQGAWSWFDGTRWSAETKSSTAAIRYPSARWVGAGLAYLAGWCASDVGVGACRGQVTQVRHGEIVEQSLVPLDPGDEIRSAGRSPNGEDYAASALGRLFHRAPGGSWTDIPQRLRIDASEIATVPDGVLVGWSDVELQRFYDDRPADDCATLPTNSDVRRLLVRGDRVLSINEHTVLDTPGVLEVSWARLRTRCDLPSQ